MKGILLGSSLCEVCSSVSRSISWDRCLPVVTAESGQPLKKQKKTKNKYSHISSHLSLKSAWSLQRRLRLKNWENGIAF